VLGLPDELRLDEVHRGRADEPGDEEVLGPLVQHLRRRNLLENALAQHATRSPIVIASVWSCVT
jgi:hypothetical protein